MSFIVAADKDRIAESEDADRGSDLTKMGRIERTDPSRRRPKISERKVRKFQARQDVIAPRMRGGRDGHSFQLVTVTAAFPSQQAGQRGGGSNRINAVSHGHLLCGLIQNHDAASAKRRFPNRENHWRLWRTSWWAMQELNLRPFPCAGRTIQGYRHAIPHG